MKKIMLFVVLILMFVGCSSQIPISNDPNIEALKNSSEFNVEQVISNVFMLGRLVDDFEIDYKTYYEIIKGYLDSAYIAEDTILFDRYFQITRISTLSDLDTVVTREKIISGEISELQVLKSRQEIAKISKSNKTYIEQPKMYVFASLIDEYYDNQKIVHVNVAINYSDSFYEIFPYKLVLRKSAEGFKISSYEGYETVKSDSKLVISAKAKSIEEVKAYKYFEPNDNIPEPYKEKQISVFDIRMK